MKEHLAAYLEERIAEEIDPAEALAGDGAAVRAIVEHSLSFTATRLPGAVRARVESREGDGVGFTAVELLLADQPFVVDTFRLNLRRLGLRERLLLHRTLAIEREEDGSIVRLGSEQVHDAREVWVYAELPCVVDEERRDEIASELESVFEHLGWIVADHGRMLRQIRQHTADVEFAERDLPDAVQSPAELQDFLSWIADDNYVFFGYRWYDARRRDGSWEVRTDPGSGLGLMRHTAGSRFLDPRRGDEIPELVRARLDDPRLVFFDKSRTASRIHREGRLDCLSVKVIDEDGELRGFGRFIGMLTHRATQKRGSDLQILRRRRDRMLEEIGAAAGSHRYKAAIEAFDSLPLEFLFPYELSDVKAVVQRILRAGERGGVEIGVVPDPQNRSFFVSVIMARSSYDEQLRKELLDLLVRKYDANYVDHHSSFVDDEVALIHFFCTSLRDVDLELLSELEQDLRERATSWGERFRAALLESYSEREAENLASTYEAAFPDEYCAATRASEARTDVERLELLRSRERSVELATSAPSRLRIYLSERPYLTDLLPILDNCGLRVLDATLTELPGLAEHPLWIVSCRMADGDAGPDPRAIDGLRAVLDGRVEDGRLNRLIKGVGLDWRTADLLRAYLAHAQQLGIAPQVRRAAAILLRYPEATRAIAARFRARFDPDLRADRAAAEREAREHLAEARGSVRTADEDRVYALLQELIEATVRTGFYADTPVDGHAIVLKLDPGRIEAAPSPRPHAEIFVHAADLAGVHLRGGPIARGGVRWSDRLGDFRTEVLGLVKTQMLKNGLIVPVGAKGGFVLKRRPAGREAARAEADRQYERFIRCLLSLTDNLEDGRIVPPERVVRHDGDDPYLVVAADKGTAHLSDVANRVARETGFWLGDAFASGGSEGYDHKSIGITARGAWVCARRHFLELGLDVEREQFTMVGIGDLSGDVFGNGMLLARWGKLLAAFNHQHVFLDPNPDPELSWRERRRLLALSRSGWVDYDPARISSGGGVFERDAREVCLSPEALAMLGCDDEILSGEELVRAVLRMPADLLWNGGVGTYVKASDESHAEAGDRGNDSVRVNARELRVKVVAEGGNLGFTQRARVEFAVAGGRIQTDAIDNSGGVDLSDREVNCKVLLARRVAEGRMPQTERDRVLQECTDQTAAAVLEGSGAQGRCISLDLLRSAHDARRIELAAEFLERHAGLDRALEALPDADTLRSRMKDRGVSYTRPELSVLLGYTKLLVKRELVASQALRQPELCEVRASYFPELLRERFAPDIKAHPLADEITATRLSNLVIDQAGVTLIPELCGALPVSVADVVSAYHTMDRLLEADALRLAIEAQALPEPTRLAAGLQVEASVREAARGLLELERSSRLEPREFERRLALVRSLREIVAPEPSDVGLTDLVALGMDPQLAGRIERLGGVVRSLGVLSLAKDAGASLLRLVDLHTRIGLVTRITWIAERLARPGRRDRWERIVAENLQLEMLQVQRNLTSELEAGNGQSLQSFQAEHAPALARIEELVARIESESPRGLAALTVAAHHVRRLA